MRVGIITYSDSLNWGAQLQALALRYAIEEKGHCAQHIDHRDMNTLLYRKGKNPKTIISNIILYRAKADLKRRIIRTENFRKNYLNMTDPCRTTDEFVALNKSFDCFITGSDQVWNCTRGLNSNFYLDFVSDDSKKCAYAASFGVSQIPSYYSAEVSERLRAYRYITVRENAGKRIVDENCGRKVQNVCDPVFLLEAEQWRKIISESSELNLTNKKYIFVYSTDISDTFIQMVNKVKKHLHLPVISTTWIPGCSVVKDIGPSEFIDYIMHAECVVTTSFHATAFSIIFHKNFYVLPHTTTGNRVTDILEKLNLTSHIVNKDTINISENLNYEQVQKKLDLYREFSLQQLEAILDPVQKQQNSLDPYATVESIHDICTGCRVCENVCPQNCIHFEYDKEGFIYPVIDKEQCISCGLCLKKCHINHKKPELNTSTPAFYGYAKDESIRLKGSSGGAFGAIVALLQKLHGTTWVFGSVYDSVDGSVHQQGFISREIEPLYQSKYVFSDTRNTFNEVKAKLKEGCRVIYCGTPCQIGALKSYLAEADKNLITIDFICHGVPSDDFIRRHIEYVTNDSQNISIEFRSKAIGWGLHKHCLKINNHSGKAIYLKKAGQDFFFTHFLNNDCLRLGCYHCHYSNRHVSDLTLGDFWEVSRIDPAFDDAKGLSVIFANTECGKEIVKQLSTVMSLKKCPSEYKRSHCGCKPEMLKNRNDFFKQLEKVGLKNLERRFKRKRIVLVTRKVISRFLKKL